ncbi:MAG: hypothetical protein QXU34_06195 [Ignisphaera sp.]
MTNLRKLVVMKARRNDDKLGYREHAAVVTPTKVVIYNNPLRNITKYEHLKNCQ